MFDAHPARLAEVAASLGERATPLADDDLDGLVLDAVVLATPSGDHAELARSHLRAGRHVVSTSDDIDDVVGLLELDDIARRAGRRIVAGAGFAPGLSCILARHAAADVDQVHEVHVASIGTGGPSCARRHHAALAANGLDYRDGTWVVRRGGSGRELCWFPDPVGAQDCYHAARPDGLLLVPVFPGVRRVSVRVAATRRDRLTARLPMLRPPHPEGAIGAVRVEVRGERHGTQVVTVLGSVDRPAVAAGAVAAVAATALAGGSIGTAAGPGAGGVAALCDSVAFLAELARRGVKAAAFTGSTPTTW